MNTNELINRLRTGEKDITRTQLSEIQPIDAPINGEIPTHHEEPLLVASSLVLITWVFVFIVQLRFWKSVGNRLNTPKSLCKSPCSNCQFFQNNPYLKCAVHPSKVLSEEASDCPDYCPQDNK